MLQYRWPRLRESAFFFPPLRDWRRKKYLALSRRISKLRPKRVLEIGCGMGSFSRLLARRFPQSQILAIDLSQRMVDAAKKPGSLPNLTFQKMDFLEVRGSFDLVISINAFEELNLEKAFMHTREVLDRDGLCLVVVTVPGIFSRIHERFFFLLNRKRLFFKMANGWIELAERAGFRASYESLVDFERSVLMELRLPKKNDHLFDSSAP